jgi:hypothetical protein
VTFVGPAAPDRRGLLVDELTAMLGGPPVAIEAAQIRVFARLESAIDEPGPAFDRLWDQSRPDDLMLVVVALFDPRNPSMPHQFAPGELGEFLMLSGWRPLGRVDENGVEYVVAQRTTIMPHAYR